MGLPCLRWSHVTLFSKIIVSFVLLPRCEEEPHFLELNWMDLRIKSKN
jgi:hypothetical protein